MAMITSAIEGAISGLAVPYGFFGDILATLGGAIGGVMAHWMDYIWSFFVV